jgi:hypothetical protein
MIVADSVCESASRSFFDEVSARGEDADLNRDRVCVLD